MAETPPGTTPEIMNALGALGKMLNIASIYGMQHPSVANPLQEAYRLLSDTLKTEKQIAVGLFNKTLTVNGLSILDYTVHLRALERKFASLDIPPLVFREGITMVELGQLVGALSNTGKQAESGIQQKLEEAGLNHINTENVEYVARQKGQHLTGDEEGGGRGSEGEKSGTPNSETSEEAAPSPQVHVDQIVAFLKGDPASSDEPPSEDLKEMLSDPEKLGQLIMESATVRQSTQALDEGESLADIVIGCLRKTYDGLARQKKYRSSRGKASLNKAMLLLEKTVVDKIHDSVGEEQPDVDEQILESLRDAEEQRQVEILAARFAEQHKKMTKTELDVLNYIREHGEDKARALLGSETIPEQEWNRLMVRSRQTGGTGTGTAGSGSAENGEIGGSGDSIDMGALAIVLDKLDTIMQLDSNTPPEIIQSTVENVRETVDSTASEAEQAVEQMEQRVEQFEQNASHPPEPRTGKKKHSDLLLEISQLTLKLAQPLTVISASIQAALQQADDPAIQLDLLQMADESATRMKDLMDRLSRLVGYPSMKEADIGIDV